MISKLLWLEPIWLLALAPLILLPTLWEPEHHRWAIVGLFLFWLVRLIVEKRIMAKTPLNVAGTILLLCLPGGIMIGVEPILAWQVAGYILFGIVLAVASIHWPPLRHRPERLAYSLIILGVGLSLLSLALYGNGLVPLNKVAAWIASIDGLVNANVLAGTLVLIIPFSLSMTITPPIAENSSTLWIRACVTSSTVLLGIGLWITESRGGYLAALVACAVVMGLHWLRLRQLLLLILLSGIASFGLIWMAYFSLLDVYWLAGLAEGWQDRMVIWERVWFALQDFPFTGIGIGQFGVVIPEFYPYFHRFNANIPHAHNLWLQISMDLGILGLIAYLALQMNVYLMLHQAYRYFRSSRRSAHWALTIGSWGAFSALIVHGLLDAVTWGTKLSFTPWLIMALVVLLFEKTV